MKTETKTEADIEQAGLVRDVITELSRKFPKESDKQLQTALFAKAIADLEGLGIHQVRRLHEAAAKTETVSEAVDALNVAIARRLWRHYNLRAYRPAAKAA